jgi:hypothetical protein
MFEVDGEDGLVRFWDCFHATDRLCSGNVTGATLAPLLRAEVSQTLGQWFNTGGRAGVPTRPLVNSVRTRDASAGRRGDAGSASRPDRFCSAPASPLGLLTMGTSCGTSSGPTSRSSQGDPLFRRREGSLSLAACVRRRSFVLREPPTCAGGRPSERCPASERQHLRPQGLETASLGQR